MRGYETPTRLLYGDPLKALLDKEAHTCAGCKHRATGTAFGVGLVYCTFVDATGKRRNSNDQRCKHYHEGKK